MKYYNCIPMIEAEHICEYLSCRDLDLWVGADPCLKYYYLNGRRKFVSVEATLPGVPQGINIRSLDDLAKPADSHIATVWSTTEGELTDPWAPEIFRLLNPETGEYRYYIYVALHNHKQDKRSMYVLESQVDDPLSGYTVKSQLLDHWSIDGTIGEHNGNLYLIYSCMDDEKQIASDPFPVQVISIVKMATPWTTDGEPIVISRPEYPWEGKINEAPQIHCDEHGGLRGIYISAEHSLTSKYKQMYINFNGIDLYDSAMWSKCPEPVSDDNFGHIGFVTDINVINAASDICVYHAKTGPDGSWEDRRTKLRIINSNNTPSLKEIA